MASTIAGFDTRGVHTTYFSDDLPDGNGVVLSAAVLWRSPPPRRGLRTLLRRLRAWYGPQGRGFHLRGRFKPWSGTSGPHGTQETLYSRERRVVKVLDREYPLPADGRTLVLLIDELQNLPALRQLALPAPTFTLAPNEPGIPADQLAGGGADEHAAWLAALQAHPEIRTFLEDA